MKKFFVTAVSIFAFIICCMAVSTVYASDIVISDDDVSLSKTTYTYTGKSQKPSVTVNVDGMKLERDVDYTVSYHNNVHAGSASVVVKAAGDYTGSVIKSFTIKKKSLSGSGVNIRMSKVIAGGVGNFNASYNGKKLHLKKDFVLVSKDVSKVGKNAGKYVISGIGNFTGKITVKCNVYPKKVVGVTVTEKTNSTISIKWNSQSKYGVTGYKVYTCDNKGGNKRYYKTVKANKITIEDLDPGEYFCFYVRAYKISGDTTLYSDFNKKFITCSKPARVVITSVTSATDKKSIKVTWEQVPCTGYEIKYSTDKDFDSNVKVIDIFGKTNTKKTIKLDASKKYYVKVRAYRRFDNKRKTCYGKWSVRSSNRFSNVYVSYSTTYYGSSENRCTNIRIACEMIDGTILQPGDTFSFDAIVGRRTADKGFKEAPVFLSSTEHGMSLGGGICQVASTMFNAALYGNLSIVERHQHTQRVGYVPLGRDAALNWGTKNFRFKNNTKYAIKIHITAKDHKLTCKFLTSENVSHKKVSLKVTQSGNTFTLKRYVDGKSNYTTKSTY